MLQTDTIEILVRPVVENPGPDECSYWTAVPVDFRPERYGTREQVGGCGSNPAAAIRDLDILLSDVYGLEGFRLVIVE